MTESVTHGRSVKFTKYDKTPTWIKITGERDIHGGGVFGQIFLTDTLVLGRPRRFIVKKFLGNPDRAKREAERAFNNYRKAKNAGLKVLPTYRISGDNTSILMTNLNVDSTLVLSNNRDLGELGLPPIRNEALTPGLTDSIIEHAKLASEHKILIPVDAYFFLYNQVQQTTDFTLGDLDKLGQDVSAEHALWYNLKTARSAVMSFMASNSESPYLQIRNADARFKAEGEMGN